MTLTQRIENRRDLRQKWKGLSPRYAAVLEAAGASPIRFASRDIETRYAAHVRTELFFKATLAHLDDAIESAEAHGETRATRLARLCRSEAATAAIVAGEGGVAYARRIVEKGLRYLADESLAGPVCDGQSQTPAPVDRPSADELMTACKHESGHCCVMLSLGYRIDYATVTSRGGGSTAITEKPRTAEHDLAFAIAGVVATDCCGRDRFGLGSDIRSLQRSLEKLTGEQVDRMAILDHPVVNAERERQHNLIVSHLAPLVVEVADLLYRNINRKVDGTMVNAIFDRWIEDRE